MGCWVRRAVETAPPTHHRHVIPAGRTRAAGASRAQGFGRTRSDIQREGGLSVGKGGGRGANTTKPRGGNRHGRRERGRGGARSARPTSGTSGRLVSHDMWTIRRRAAGARAGSRISAQAPARSRRRSSTMPRNPPRREPLPRRRRSWRVPRRVVSFVRLSRPTRVSRFARVVFLGSFV